MTRNAPSASLTDALDGWAPGAVHSARPVDPWPAAAFAALLDTAVEGYPGLVVHGPLLALLALELPRRHAPTEAVTEFAYRLVRPAFAGAVVEATARCSGTDLDLSVGVVQAGPSLTATATLESS